MELKCGNEVYELDTIIEEFSTMLFRVAMMCMHNKEDAQDVVQDTFRGSCSRFKKAKRLQTRSI